MDITNMWIKVTVEFLMSDEDNVNIDCLSDSNSCPCLSSETKTTKYKLWQVFLNLPPPVRHESLLMTETFNPFKNLIS